MRLTRKITAGQVRSVPKLWLAYYSGLRARVLLATTPEQISTSLGQWRGFNLSQMRPDKRLRLGKKEVLL